MSHCITSAVQRKSTKSSYCFLKVMIQHSLKKKARSMACEKQGSQTLLQMFCFCTTLITRISSYFHFKERLAPIFL